MKAMVCNGEFRASRTADLLRSPSTLLGDSPLDGSINPLASMHEEEARLLEGCLRGENEAWKAVFKHYHPKLVAYISVVSQSRSGEHAEEVAAAVWCALWCGESMHFRRYKPQFGGLLNYFKSLARVEIWRRRRSERSRRFREYKVARNESTRDEVGRGLVLQEFLATLTPREREFCLSILMSVSESGGRPDLSTCNEWKLRSRVMKKFRMYMLQNN